MVDSKVGETDGVAVELDDGELLDVLPVRIVADNATVVDPGVGETVGVAVGLDDGELLDVLPLSDVDIPIPISFFRPPIPARVPSKEEHTKTIMPMHKGVRLNIIVIDRFLEYPKDAKCRPCVVAIHVDSLR